jgi:hypothetical protein
MHRIHVLRHHDLMKLRSTDLFDPDDGRDPFAQDGHAKWITPKLGIALLIEQRPAQIGWLTTSFFATSDVFGTGRRYDQSGIAAVTPTRRGVRNQKTGREHDRSFSVNGNCGIAHFVHRLPPISRLAVPGVAVPHEGSLPFPMGYETTRKDAACRAGAISRRRPASTLMYRRQQTRKNEAKLPTTSRRSVTSS